MDATPQRPPSPDVFAPPRVNPVGLVEYADGSTHGPRPARGSRRLVVWLFLVFFAVAALGTSILSVGAYCLTSHGADTRALHSAFEDRAVD
ncbi:MAG: hypothetical protein AAGD06_30845 [Acidobacteriota bacterium]